MNQNGIIPIFMEFKNFSKTWKGRINPCFVFSEYGATLSNVNTWTLPNYHYYQYNVWFSNVKKEISYIHEITWDLYSENNKLTLTDMFINICLSYVKFILNVLYIIIWKPHFYKHMLIICWAHVNIILCIFIMVFSFKRTLLLL